MLDTLCSMEVEPAAAAGFEEGVTITTDVAVWVCRTVVVISEKEAELGIGLGLGVCDVNGAEMVMIVT